MLSYTGLGVRWALTTALAVGVGVLAVALVRPDRVAPIAGPDGRPAPGSVATLEKVHLGGVDQWVSIRGSNVENPVLLHVSGGKSYPALDPTETFTLDRMVADGIELSRWLTSRFDEQTIYLTGNSWGSTLGVLTMQRDSELFWAHAGTGQMVSQREADRVLYDQLLEYADCTGDAALQEQLRAFGEPPYRDVLAYAKVMEYYDLIEPYRHRAEFERARGLSGFFPDEYSLLDTWNETRGFADMGG